MKTTVINPAENWAYWTKELLAQLAKNQDNVNLACIIHQKIYSEPNLLQISA